MNILPLDLTIPAHMLRVLAIVQQADRNAIIGGGALRDTMTGRSVKDIDIFVGPDVTWPDLRDAFSRSLGSDIFSFDFNGRFGDGRSDLFDDVRIYGEYFRTSIDNVLNVRLGIINERFLPEYHDIQIVVMAQTNSMEEQLERFDLSFCRIVSDGKSTMTTEDCLDSMARKEIKIVLDANDNRLRGSIRRATRLQAEKYQDWDIKLPMSDQAEDPTAMDEVVF